MTDKWNKNNLYSKNAIVTHGDIVWVAADNSWGKEPGISNAWEPEAEHVATISQDTDKDIEDLDIEPYNMLGLYQKGDVVSNNGKVYKSLMNHMDKPVTNTKFWKHISTLDLKESEDNTGNTDRYKLPDKSVIIVRQSVIERDGKPGEVGLTGANGIQGVQGIPGKQGIQGLKGDKGDRGDKGDSYNPKELDSLREDFITGAGSMNRFRLTSIGSGTSIIAHAKPRVAELKSFIAGANTTITHTATTITIASTGGGGSGTVSSVSVVTANGFAGTVATATTTPAITLSTTITGILKGNGTAISAAIADTDYQVPITLTTTGTSGAATFTADTLNIPQYQASGSYITALTGDGTASGPGSAVLTLATVNANVGSFGTGTAMSVITVNGKGLITAASSLNLSYIAMSSVSAAGTNQATATVLTASTQPGYFAITSTPSGTGVLLPVTNTSRGGYVIINQGANALLVYPNGTNTINGMAASAPYTIPVGGSIRFLSSGATAWSTNPSFQGGDVNTPTSSGQLTLATVNGNVGSFGSSTSIPSFTVNGKGLITAASGNVVISPAGTLTGTTLNSTVVTSSLTSVGTITSGTWNGTTLDVAHGGTGDTSVTAYSPIVGGTTSTGALQSVSTVGATAGQVLTYQGTSSLPTWTTISGTGTVTSVATGAGLTGGPVTTTGTISLDLTHVNAWTGQQYFATSALTPGTTVPWNLNTQQTASLTPAQNFTLSNPTNMVNGGTYTLIITQDGTGSRVITWGAAYKFAGGTKFILSTAASAVDIITFLSDGTSIFAVGQAAFS